MSEKYDLHRRTASSPKHSVCHSAKLSELDWDNWWEDHSFNLSYLHVRGADRQTWHRVWCRQCGNPRLMMENGRLMWVYPPPQSLTA